MFQAQGTSSSRFWKGLREKPETEKDGGSFKKKKSAFSRSSNPEVEQDAAKCRGQRGKGAGRNT